MSPRVADLYAVLQVTPDAEPEVIEAAYRQLIRKYHPDLAGADESRAKQLNERAKLINQAYAILRDRDQRAAYDHMRLRTVPPPGPRTSTSVPPPPPTTPPPPPPPPPPESVDATSVEDYKPSWWAYETPIGMLSAAFFLLPGPYEWDKAGQRERNFAFFVPPLCVLVWLAASGRLGALIGHSVFAVGLVVLLCFIALIALDWRSLPRLALAGGSTALLLSGLIDASLSAVAVPTWMGWIVIGATCLLLAARLYVFGVMPTVVVCTLIARLTD
jgi:hypothetical protein